MRQLYGMDALKKTYKHFKNPKLSSSDCYWIYYICIIGKPVQRLWMGISIKKKSPTQISIRV